MAQRTIDAWSRPAGAPATPVQRPDDPLADPHPGYFGGFAASVFSGIPELFGAQPSETAAAFRNEYPISGVASQLISPIPEYAAAFRLSRVPALATRLEGATARVVGRFGLDVAESPIRAGIVREAIRYAPLEASRLAVGGLAYDAFDDGFFGAPLFADVALSTAFTGGIGGVGGWLRAGGRRTVAALPHVEGADLRLSPTHQLDLVMQGQTVVGEGATDFRNTLRQEILTEQTARSSVSNRPLPYVRAIEGAENADDVANVNSLFEARARAPSSRGGLSTRLLQEGPADDFRTVSEGEQATVAAELGVDNVDEVLRHSMFPRVQYAQGPNGARALNNILSRAGWSSVGEQGFMAREPEGAFIVARRLSQGNGRLQGVVHGNDRWFVAKTTHPAFFFPEASRLSNSTTATWARWRQQFQPSFRNNVFDAANDTFEQAITFQDFHDLMRMNKREGAAQLASRLAARVTDEAFPGIRGQVRDSESLRRLADNIFDVVKPTEFLARQDSHFGRLFATLRNATRVADNYAERIVRGKARLTGSPLLRKNYAFESGFNGHRPISSMLDDITDEEANLIMHINDTGRKGPAAAADELVASGELSEAGATVLRELQAVNKDFLDEVVIPAVRDLPQTADVKWLDGYVAPRLYRGDHFMEVKNEAGNVRFLAVGKNRAMAEGQARAVIAEANNAGHKWTYGDRRHLLDPSASDLDRIQTQLAVNLSRDDADSDIIFKAMRKLAATRASTGRNPAIPGSTSTLRTRTGLRGSPDVVQYNKKDLLEAIDGHIRTLGRFAAVQSWRERYGSLALQWGKNNPTLYKNIIGKANQTLGSEGEITKTINKTLSVIPGLGPKGGTKIAAAANEVMYAWNLGLLNTSFALLNAITPLQTVAPEIAFLTRAPAHEIQRLYGFVPVFDNAGKARGAGAMLEPLRVLKEATKLAGKPTPELLEMYGRAVDDNLFSAQLYENFVGTHSRSATTLRDAFKAEGYVGFMRKGARIMAERSEEFSRIVSFNAGTLVGKSHFGLEGEELYRFARRLNEQTMFQYGTVDRARLITGPAGSVFGLFKNWQMHFLGNMINYAGLGIRTGTWSPLLWNVAAASALGGLGATPLKVLADGLARWNTDAPSAYLWMQENWHDSADEVYFGLPAFLGVSLQASSAIPGTDVRNDLSQLSSIVLVERMKALGKAMGNAWTVQTATGQNALRDPNIRDQFMGALAPRFLVHAASAVEGDYVRSMTTGSPMLQGVSPAGRLLHAAGMNTVEIERYRVASREMYQDQEERRSMIQGLGQAYADAMGNNDSERMEGILQRATAMNVPLHSVIQSAITRGRREQQDVLARFDRRQQVRYRAALEPPPQ